MSKFIPFAEDENIKRDVASGAVVNTNVDLHAAHVNSKKQKKNMERRIQMLEEIVMDLQRNLLNKEK